MAESTYEYQDYDDIEAILPDDFTPGDDNYSLDGNNEPMDEVLSMDEDSTEIATAEPEVQVETEESTITPEPTEQAVEEQPHEEASSIEQELEAVRPQTIKVKFNHEEKEIGLDEAAILSQKGLNYDKLEQQNKDLKDRISKAEILARKLGYNNPDEMYEAAENSFIEARVKDLVDAGNSEAIARFLVKQELAEAAAPVQTPPLEEAPTPQEQQPQSLMPPERKAELLEFVKAYPGITKLPEKVLEDNANGTRLIVAYERYMSKTALDKANSELAILRQNQAAADKAPVTGLTGKSAADMQKQKIDPFIEGFDSDDY